MTQKEFADELYVAQTLVSQWELGLCEPNFDTLIKITEILDCSFEELFF